MRNRFIQMMRTPSRLRRWDAALILLPALLWYGAIQLRPYVVDLRCYRAPEECEPKDVNRIDKATVRLVDEQADRWSYATQYAAGALAVGLPAVCNGARMAAGTLGPAGLLVALGTDVAILAEATLWNGVLMETARAGVQRPRPFVYMDPGVEGANPDHYSSSYSGHTSFAALAGMTLFLILSARRAARPLLVVSTALSVLLMIATGVLRILAGRHFISDVAVSVFAGVGVALLIAWVHRRPTVPEGPAPPP